MASATIPGHGSGRRRLLVSIVTPALNAARFIEDTIQSVLAQNYPDIEYIVMDGGSTDGTLAILERYRDRLQYVSEKDFGTADAINRGFLRSRGSILAWISADDTYLPGAIAGAVAGFQAEPEAAVVYGEGYWTNEDGVVLGRYPTATSCDAQALARECGLCQPACFIRREAAVAVGMLNTSLQSAFDYDLWIRLSQRYRFSSIPAYLATSRMHKSNKSLGEKRRMFEESIELLRRHFGYVPVNWIYGYLSFLRDRRDQFFEPLRRSPLTYGLSLPVGCYYNKGMPFRFCREWASRLVGPFKSAAERGPQIVPFS
jgi:glycosyltransferase involved in cell wall biosynthesis